MTKKGVVGQRTWGRKSQGLQQASALHVYIQTYFQAGKLQMKSQRLKFL